MDDWEMRDDVQDEVTRLWQDISTENVTSCADIDGYWDDFYRMFGFRISGVDYDADISPEVKIPSIS